MYEQVIRFFCCNIQRTRLLEYVKTFALLATFDSQSHNTYIFSTHIYHTHHSNVTRAVAGFSPSEVTLMAWIDGHVAA